MMIKNLWATKNAKQVGMYTFMERENEHHVGDSESVTEYCPLAVTVTATFSSGFTLFV